MSELFLSLLIFAAVATGSPGGATTLATASGAQFGLQRSLRLLAGVSLGLAMLMAVVAGGLGSLVAAWPQFQLGLRLVGSAYLLWLAWTIARQAGPDVDAGVEGGAAAAPLGVAAGALLLWLNPKAWSMAVAAAGAYAGLAGNAAVLALLLGAVFGLAAAVSLTLWCTGGAWLARRLQTRRQWRALNLVLGLLLVASIVPMWR